MKINKNDMPIVMQTPDSLMRNTTGFGGMAIAYNELRMGTDFAPPVKGVKE